ncbi:Beta-glucosidase 42, partial [Mucuna pruriens]
TQGPGLSWIGSTTTLRSNKTPHQQHHYFGVEKQHSPSSSSKTPAYICKNPHNITTEDPLVPWPNPNHVTPIVMYEHLGGLHFALAVPCQQHQLKWNLQRRIEGEDVRWFSTIYYLKGDGTQCNIVRGIIAIFSPRNPVNPFVRMIISKAAEIHFNSAVNPLCLAIRVGMLHRLSPLNVVFSTQLLDYTSCKLEPEDSSSTTDENDAVLRPLEFMNDMVGKHRIKVEALMPYGLGTKVNDEGITFYNNIINALLERGIQPYVTLYHWDLPLHLHESMGGWLNKQIIEYFAVYADTCFASFGDRVKNWITINEPLQTAINGYDLAIFAPGRGENALIEPYLAAHHQILAHAAAVSVYRSKYKDKQGGQVGLVVDCEWAEANSDKIEDKFAAARRLDFQLGWPLLPPLAQGLNLDIDTSSVFLDRVKSLTNLIQPLS